MPFSKLIKRLPSSKVSRTTFIKRFDRFIMIAGALSVLATVPQLLEIWINKSADGVSTFSWGYYVFYSLSFTTYGIIHKQIPIVFNYSLATVMYSLIVVGSLIY